MAKKVSLFDRIGGAAAVEAAVNLFYDKVLSDDSISHYFSGTNMEGQKAKQRAFLSFAFGGPVKYSGKDMRNAHASLNLSEEDFGAVAGHLVATLSELGVSQDMIDEVVEIALSVKDDVLNKTNNDSKTDSMAQKSNSENSSMYELLLEGAADAVVVIDETKDVVFWNGAAERMWGFTKEETIGQNIKNFVPDEHKAPHDGYIDHNLNTGQDRIVGSGREVEVQRKDGTRVPVFLTMSKVEEGGKTFFMAVVKDITEQKELERKAQEEAEKNAGILDQAVDGVVTMKGSTKEIIYMNESAEKLWMRSKEECLGKNINTLVPQEHQAPHDGYVNSNMTTGVNKIVGTGREVPIERPDGSVLWCFLSLSKVIIGDEVYYTAFVKDVNASRANREAFAEASKFINGMAVGDFSYNMNVEGLAMDASTEGVISNLNGLRNNIKEILMDLNNVVAAAGNDGDLSARLSVQAQGDWSELINSVNMLLTSVAEPIGEFQDIINRMAQGDLTGRFSSQASGDIQNMADALNAALGSMNDLLIGIGQNAQEVAASSEQMLAKTDGMQASTTEVASAVTEMASGAQDQAIKTDASSKLVEDVMKSANVMEDKSGTINTAAEAGSQSCGNGLEIMNKLVAFMNDIESASQETSGSIDILTERSEEIGRTLKVITDIAAQTNLLALNAAIEAARAGEAGRGFAVVADEIRNLAEESKNAATDIEKIIDNVRKDTQQASKSIETMKESVKQGNGASKEAESIFGEINDSSQETLNLSKEVISATMEQKQAIEQVVKNIEQIVVVAEETAAGTQEVASSTQELNGGMAEINQGASRLAEIADELRSGLAQFKLDR